MYEIISDLLHKVTSSQRREKNKNLKTDFYITAAKLFVYRKIRQLIDHAAPPTLVTVATVKISIFTIITVGDLPSEF